ncbi:MAG TPA: sigma-70 family RNA polymerase sigma factor [Candidatus Hydrogenedentes bacterium]|nr:sigma-70 family RNA polymerase sigma factor [Candidatus Hydrogenedentota bacterium]HOK89931.1 sigma-70 family RNA polymerase sigma factor [Candidatus Hydrogenedentota bacterium]HOV61708.1 sigma-70 family RNA polymerase sigma factor [Candidatus Hydrogenedentota bacterium]HPO29841.1 sigma-70 family RNA polymerase sigma factor [Candidatus Hydrogenedentota bacterium]
MDDIALVEAVRSGRMDAFDEIVRRYQGRIYAAAYRIVGNREDALDVTQDALVKIYQKLDTWAPTGTFSSWVMRLATNQAIDRVRQMKRRPQEALDERIDYTGEGALPSAPPTDAGARASEIEDRVRKALEKLSPMQRMVFELRHFEGLALADIAGELGCSIGSVKVHLFRALKKLREELRDLAPEWVDDEEEQACSDDG